MSNKSWDLGPEAVVAPEHAAAVTPNDSADLTNAARLLFIGTGGNLKIDTTGGETVTLTNIAAGWHVIAVARVYAADTTADNIVAFW